MSTELERAKADLLAPMRELHQTAVREVSRLETELAGAKKTKREIEQLLRGVDPEFPNPYAKNGRKKQPQHPGTRLKYSPERAEQMTVWLQERAEQLNAMNDGEGFFATEVVEMGPPVAGQSGLSAILHQLHGTGIIRLAKRGGIGGRKYYKVVV